MNIAWENGAHQWLGVECLETGELAEGFVPISVQSTWNSQVCQGSHVCWDPESRSQTCGGLGCIHARQSDTEVVSWGPLLQGLGSEEWRCEGDEN